MLARVRAAASLAADEAELSAEKVALSVADDVLKKAGDKELSDEIALKKAQDAVLKAMEKGDKDEVSKLQAKVRELTATEAADEKIKLAAAKEVRGQHGRRSVARVRGRREQLRDGR